jgi:hypothetical protein
MPARKRPTLEDTVTARRTLLNGLAHDVDIFELVSELVPLHPRDNTFPGEVFLRLAADALDWCGASRADPLPLEGLRERFLPECAFRGRQNKKFQYAVLAAAALHGGTDPDLLDEVVWWQSDDFWQYALFAAVAYVRAAASRADPLPLEGLRERFLPECAFRGRQNKKFQYAVLAAAALHGGTDPDLLDEVAWWQSDDFWQYALFAAVAYVRAAASRAGVPLSQACQDLAQRSGDPAP